MTMNSAVHTCGCSVSTQVFMEVAMYPMMAGKCLYIPHNIIFIVQGLFQDFASEGANTKFQNSGGGGGGGKYKSKGGQPHIKRTESQFLGGGGQTDPKGGAKAPPGPPPSPRNKP